MAQAEAALSKSLDELIAEQRSKKDNQKQKKEARRGNKPDGPAPRRASGGAPRREPRNLSITVKNQGAIGKPPRRSGGGGRAPLMVVEREENPEKRAAALEGNAKWGHDLYRGPVGGGAGGAGRRAPRGPRDPTPLGTKLFISNLHYNVTDADIKELFETCGAVAVHKVHYDPSGRSEGTAEVVYKEAADAERAMRRYNNVQLDGQAMQIELIPQGAGNTGGGSGGPRTLSSGIRISGEKGGTRMVQLTRHFKAATGGGSGPVRVRGRGSVRSGVSAMQE